MVVLYINSNTELHELLRLPVLMEHFAELREQTASLSFWDYLVMHYKNDVSHDDHDTKLPFKNPAHAFIAATLSICAQHISIREVSPTEEIQHSSFYTEGFVASPLNEIFQPPRLG